MDSRRILGALVGIGALVGLLVAPGAEADPPRSSESPTRVIVLVLDQASPDTFKRYDMGNVQALMRSGVNFSNGMVGH
ncbi:MAG: hypothetical protein ACRDQD_25710, partial [Nocardioidaceae bacterium]